jgi:hypothetical protein
LNYSEEYLSWSKENENKVSMVPVPMVPVPKDPWM